MPTYFQRPENALKRADEFIDVGKKQRALDALYDVIKSKKHRTWQKIHEQIMAKYLELCVDLRKSHIAKEGLYQYKIICQQVNINSLVDVVENYLKLAEKTTEEAREQSHQAVVDVDDLDNPDTPESLLMKAVSGEDTQDRTDRAILTPWVKFLWESYRQCLDLLRNNTRVERLYHNIAQQAFQFCIKYNRKTEFRKLCDNLRTHLIQINKQQHQQTAINLNNPDSQAMHLETRLSQLDSAITMELWQEAFKAVEDIYGLISLSKKPPKPALMANYYQKLGLVFWKSGNHLFHACTLHRLFHLSREQKKNLSQEELQRMASRVLCATLAIPIPAARNAIGQMLDMDDGTIEKQRRLATLLMLNNPPTRAQLIKDLVKYSVIQFVFPDLQNLYRWMEVEFHPLKLSHRISPCIEYINNQSDLKQYVPALQDIIITRVLKQVSQVYQSIEFNRLAALVPFASPFHLERIIVSASKQLDLQVRINHCPKSLSFGTDLILAQKEDIPEGPYIQSMPSERIRNQLAILTQVLSKAVNLVQPKENESDKENLRQQMINTYRQTAKKEHMKILKRRQIIEDRKEQLEHLNDQREREEQEQQEEQRRKAYEAEMARLDREAKEREKQRLEEEHKEIQRRHAKERIEQLRKSEMGAKFLQNIDEEDFADLDVDEIMARQVEQLEKEKKELMERLKAQEKKVDYLARAKRLEEIPLLELQFDEERVQMQKFWEEQERERIEALKKEREYALECRNRLSHMKEERDKFIKTLSESRKSDFNERLKAFEARLQEEVKKRLKERKEQRKEARREKYYREKREREVQLREEAQKREMAEREKLETERREREMREKMAEAKERMAKLEEQAAKQRARELEIEMKEKKRREEQMREMMRESKAEETVEKKEEEKKERTPWKPVIKEGGWRERTLLREDSWRKPDVGKGEDDWRKARTERIPAREDRFGDDDRDSAWPTKERDVSPKLVSGRSGPGSVPPRPSSPRDQSPRATPSRDRQPRDSWRDKKEDDRDKDDRWNRRDDDDWRRGGPSTRDDGWRDRAGPREETGGSSWRDRAGPREETGSAWRERGGTRDDRWRGGAARDGPPKDGVWGRDRDRDRGAPPKDDDWRNDRGPSRDRDRDEGWGRERGGRDGSWRGGSSGGGGGSSRDDRNRDDRGPPPSRDSDWGRRGMDRGDRSATQSGGTPSQTPSGPRNWRTPGTARGDDDDDGWTTVRY